MSSARMVMVDMHVEVWWRWKGMTYEQRKENGAQSPQLCLYSRRLFKSSLPEKKNCRAQWLHYALIMSMPIITKDKIHGNNTNNQDNCTCPSLHMRCST